MKNLNIADFKRLEGSEIVNNILEDSFDGNLLVENLNFLNSIEMVPNMEFFNLVEHISKHSILFDKEFLTKKRLEDDMVKIEEGVILVDDEVDDERITCLNFVSLVKLQYSRFSSFFMDYRRDGRIRTYNYNFPLNFQLSHLVRNSIGFRSTNDDKEGVLLKFMSLKFWDFLGKAPEEISLFFWQKIERGLINKVCWEFGLEYKEGDILSNMELEGVLVLIESFAPKKIIPLSKRIE